MTDPRSDDGPTRTDDGRWIVVDGRRWRASDPSIPDRFRTELVAELMDARRAVGSSRRAPSDGDAEQAARARVQDAKVALGERGEPWWDEPTPDGRAARIRATVLALAGHRGPDRTICPSDVARAIGGEHWRPLMEPVRDVARELVRAAAVEVTQKGVPLDGDVARELVRAAAVEVTQKGVPLDADGEWRGPVRIRRTAG